MKNHNKIGIAIKCQFRHMFVNMLLKDFKKGQLCVFI